MNNDKDKEDYLSTNKWWGRRLFRYVDNSNLLLDDKNSMTTEEESNNWSCKELSEEEGDKYLYLCTAIENRDLLPQLRLGMLDVDILQTKKWIKK